MMNWDLYAMDSYVSRRFDLHSFELLSPCLLSADLRRRQVQRFTFVFHECILFLKFR